MGRKRWEGLTAEERKAKMAELRLKGGRPKRSEDRCPCGKFTRAYAERRRHKCAALLTQYESIHYDSPHSLPVTGETRPGETSPGALDRLGEILNESLETVPISDIERHRASDDILRAASGMSDEQLTAAGYELAPAPAAAPPPLPIMSAEPCQQCGRLADLHRDYSGPLQHDYVPQVIVRAPEFE